MRSFIVCVAIAFGIMSMPLSAAIAPFPAASTDDPMDSVAGEPYEGYKGETIFEDVKFVMSSGAYVSNLGKVDAGVYQLTLTDFIFPNAFSDLRVAISTATTIVSLTTLKEGFNQAVQYIDLSASDSYYLSVYGSTETPGYALYGVELAHFEPAPVPVPASVYLLFSGIVAWGATSLKRKKVA